MFDLLRILIKWRRPLVLWVVLAGALAAIFAWTATPRYSSEASILPPADNNPAFGGISALLQQYQIPIPGGINTPFLPTLYASIISSRKMRTRILDEFELRPIFKAETESGALEMLRERTFLKYTDENILLVAYEDTSPERAANVVNAYVHYLDEFIQEINASRAADTRRFVEGQVERCLRDLALAEEALKDFQLRNRAIEIDTQTEGALDIAAEIQGRILAAEVELDLLRKYALPGSHELQGKQSELDALKKLYKRLMDADAAGASEDPASRPDPEGRMFPPFEQVPDLALQYMRLLREVKVQTTLYTMLLQQLEQARIEEQKNTRVLSVLDWAVPGEQPVHPPKIRWLAAAMLVAFVWVTVTAVFIEKLRERREDEAEAARVTALRREWERMPGWIRSFERLVVK